MLSDNNKNLKDSPSQTLPEGKGRIYPLSFGEGAGVRLMSYTKTNKLITALYMVTDIMDKEDPLRNKLRTLGVYILSDMHSLPLLSKERVGVRFLDEILSLLEIASAVGMISEMNSSILIKEFVALKESINESKKDLSLSEFFNQELSTPSFDYKSHPSRGELGSTQRHNIGLQKGSTLMHALNKISDKNLKDTRDTRHINISNGQNISDKKIHISQSHSEAGDSLKKERRSFILKIIKDKKEEVSIKDIALSLQGLGIECGEKTLQRELVSMVLDGVLLKSGEKRWSRYSLN